MFSQFPWLKEKNLPMIISADYDGLICASFLHHHLNWQLEGYYDLNTIWITDKGIKEKQNLIWVDLNILPKQGKAIGGHIVSISGEVPPGFQSSCNPNILANITAGEFRRKFPFSTLIYLLWLHKIEIKNDLLARLLVLHSDATWLKYQQYTENSKNWQKSLPDYNWSGLFQRVNTKAFEKRIDENLYPLFQSMQAVTGKSKLRSKHLNICSKQFQCNPDWDEDVILKLLNLFGNTLGWTPPKLPTKLKSINGIRKKVPLALIKEIGLSQFLKENRVFSYAIPSPRIFNFTSFGMLHKSPLEKKT
ncbi:MAG: hypothetical protein H8E85_01115 [Candidatus Marinimicrobia bacterium]|nr:hypothetical protein [Candidatus Neomarinimicrobiota bacterium]